MFQSKIDLFRTAQFWYTKTHMLKNPVQEAQERKTKEENERRAFRYPIQIVAVYSPSTGRESSVKELRQLKDFCETNHLSFSGREYDFERFNEDRDEISKLPAYHIYMGYDWDSTHYFERTDFVKPIQEAILNYKAKQEKKRRKQEQWAERKERFVEFLKWNPFKKQPKLQLPPRPKSLPAAAAVPLELPTALPKDRRKSL